MANDCDCKIRISGEPDNVKRLYDKLQINEVIKKGSLNLDNYELLFESVGDVEDWGSKWQVFSNIEYYHGDNSMLIEGYSAWNPAEGLWKKVSKDFNLSIECEYSERGNDFAGFVCWSDGDETNREEMTYFEYLIDNDYEFFWEEIGYQCEYDELESVISSLGSVYETLTEDEKERLEDLHKERFME